MKILLFANVGTNVHGFYHAGDEAMFYQEYHWYQKHHPKAQLTVFSSVPSHHHLKVQEYYGLPWPTRTQFFKLIAKAILWQLTPSKNMSRFSPEEQQFISIVSQQDRIHFTGGGNLTSLFPSWLYYSLFLIFLGWLLRKEVILTSQTIGPFYGIDRVLAPCILNLVTEIKIRESGPAAPTLLKLGIFLPKTGNMMDAAYDLSSQSTWQLPTHKNRFCIGLSLHDWDQQGPEIEAIVVKLIESLSQTYDLTVLLIPHVFSKNFAGPSNSEDLVFMKNITQQLPRPIRIITPTYQALTTTALEPAVTIKKMSTAMDFLITSRYHGLIFALSGNTPCLSLTAGTYYRQKMTEGLKLFYGAETDISKYQIDLDLLRDAGSDLKKAHNLMAHLTQEKELLAINNRKIKNERELS